MQFEWDKEKERRNIAKHGISFKTAMRVFEDYDRIENYDSIHSQEEDRYITIGEVNGEFIIVQVVYTERSQAIRIISARLASRAEKEAYYDSKKNT